MKKIISKLALVLCAGLLIAGCAKDEEVLTGSIRGFVSDYANANQAIAGVTVTINSKGLTKTTGSDGRFEFSGLEPMTYSLSFAANDYQPTTKQITVYAGETANCDVQLDRSSALIDISPLTLTFGKNVDQASFSIINNGNTSFNYSISSYPDYVKVSPASGTVAGKGKQAVSISIINRKTINEDKNGQLIVNVGNDSYIVSFSVEAYQGDVMSIDVSPQSLKFDKDTEQLTFAITNNGNRDVNYNISNNLDILTVSPTSGSLAPSTKNTITVGIKDRKSVTENRTGQITIDIEGNTFTVAVSVDKYEEDNPDNPDNPNPGQSEVSTNRGLLAYYTFDNDNADNMYRDNDHGFIVEKADFITDTPNEKGKALSLERGSFVNIPSNLLDEKNTFTVSMWLKDFGAGFIFRTQYQWGYYIDNISISSPSLYINNENKLRIAYSRYGDVTSNFSIQQYQSSNWDMLTIVWDGSAEKILVYLDGKKIDSIGTGWTLSQGESMQIGGTDPMKVDNVRIHSVALSDKEVAEIYTAESK